MTEMTDQERITALERQVAALKRLLLRMCDDLGYTRDWTDPIDAEEALRKD